MIRQGLKAAVLGGTVLAATVLVAAAAGAPLPAAGRAVVPAHAPQRETATFAGGCFWSMEHVFEDLAGVVSTTVGYAGGSARNPTYEQVEMGVTGHAESVQVAYDPAVIMYEQLLDTYWHNIDPTDGSGQFCDHGTQYRPIIFYADGAQQRLADESKAALEASHRFPRVMAQVRPAGTFWRAEDYHQHYSKTHGMQYRMYRIGCGRDARLAQLWGKHAS
jgi:peptide-methionine (S)-S-oxide reductase